MIIFIILNIILNYFFFILKYKRSDNDFEYSIYDKDLNKYLNSVSYAHSIKTAVWFY